MMKSISRISITALLVFVLSFSQNNIRAQGCSDAGFCTIGSFKPEAHPQKGKKESGQRLSFLSPIGVGDENVFIWTPSLQYDYFSSKGWNLQGKITSNYATGTLGSFFGAGDVFLSASKTNVLKGGWHFIYTIGTKIPLNQANASEGGMPLPMQYQSSLGTFDAIIGATFSNPHWQFSAGYQQPLSGENKNGFLPEFWNGKPEAMNYPRTFQLERKGDVLLRGARNFNVNPSLNFNAGLLGIFHLGEDQYTNPFEGNNKFSIVGSSGLTLNLTGSAFWQVGNHTRFGLTGGVPLAVRDVRPDGLTRSWVLIPEFSFSF
jgi:hypothetical protein